MDKNRRKQRKKYIAWGCAGIFVFLLAVMPILAAGAEGSDGPEASILSATAEHRDIDTQIIGGGQLASEAAVQLEIPEAVKLTQYLVGNGGIVSQGDAIAAVDRVSVMTAITQVQETLDYLSEEIADISSEEASDQVTARAGGTVKVIYAGEGDSVQDVMLEHGALALLSLDGLMAVQIERNTGLSTGDTVCVMLPDGTEVDGRVKSNLEGIVTVTVEDDGYSVGAKVTVTTEDGTRIGRGELYIYSQWSATAYSGTVSNVLVSEGDQVYAGKPLMSLENPGHTAQYQQLIDQRHEYEELMQELFQMYRTQTITAPCDGIVTGVDEDGAYLLSDSGSGLFASLLANLTGAGSNGFVGCMVQVAEVQENGMLLKRASDVYSISDLADLSGVAAGAVSMTETWNYTGGTTVYAPTADGLFQAAGSAEAGDILLAVGKEETVHWFVRLTADAGEASQTDAGENYRVAVLSAVGESDIPVESTDPTETEDTSGGTGQEDNAGSKNEGQTGDCTKSDDCTASVHDPDCPKAAATAVYWGYVAQVVEVTEGTMTVQQTPYAYAITDLNNLPSVQADASVMTVETVYTSLLISTSTVAAGDILLLVVDDSGTLQRIAGQTDMPGMEGPDTGGEAQTGQGGMSGGGTSSMGGGTAQEQPFTLYSLEKLTVASVTSQEHMSVEITVDELDISKIFVGQAAVITVDALAGEQFAATVTEIANNGENQGGNSKFAVELTLNKSGDMLPGMSASAFITLETSTDVLSVPVSALDEDGTQTFLYTSYDEDSGMLGDPVMVTTGISDGENVEIVDGLEDGKTVYYAYYDTLVISNAPKTGGSFSFFRR